MSEITGTENVQRDHARRIRELELRADYPDVESLSTAISNAVQALASVEVERPPPHPEIVASYETRLIELVRYAGRSGLLVKEEKSDGD